MTDGKTGTAGGTDGPRGTSRGEKGDGPRELPRVDFSTLVLSLGTTALYQLGVVPDPATGELATADPLVAQQTIDTLEIAQRVFERRNHTIQPGDLRLFNLRPRYNLPQYRAHNALSDALATAELFLAMAENLYPGRPCPLGEFLSKR